MILEAIGRFVEFLCISVWELCKAFWWTYKPVRLMAWVNRVTLGEPMIALWLILTIVLFIYLYLIGEL